MATFCQRNIEIQWSCGNTQNATSIGVNEKIYDKGVFYKMAHGYFDGHILYRRIEPILISKKNAEQYYSNTYSILEWMNKKQLKES